MHSVQTLAAMQDIRIDDWSSAVSPFWQAVIQSALSAKGVSGLLRAGWTTIKVHRRRYTPQNVLHQTAFVPSQLTQGTGVCNVIILLQTCCRVLW